MSPIKALLIAIGIAAFAPQSQASPPPEVWVVVHPTNPISSMSKAQLSALYKGSTKQFADGTRAAPVNLPFDSSVRQDFDRGVLNMSPDDAKRFWIDMKIRSGASPPRQMPTPAAVARHIAKTPNGLGYLDASEAEGLKVVARIAGGKFTER